MQVGDTFSLTRFISKEDVQGFADVTGDDNPLHVDEEYAAGTRFGHTVVHGVLLLGIVSKVLGRDYPGHGSIAVSISAKFLRPVPVGSEVEIQVKVVEKLDRHKHVRVKVYAYREGKMAVGGEAVVIPPAAED
jgi:acyl dehydratase